MAGFKSGDDEDVVASINMVPMIDVVLVLLIIFIVTASAIVKAAIAVDLPKASTSEAASKPPMSIILSCAEKQGDGAGDGSRCTLGQILVDGETVVDLQTEGASAEPLVAIVRERVAQARAEDGPQGKAAGLVVLITADKDLRFENVIWMMDLLKNEGASSIMFNSELFTRGSSAPALPR